MEMDSRDAAGCVILDGQARVLLVHQTYGPKQWSLPGGVVEAGESAWDGCRRECREEIGIDVDPYLTGLYYLPHRDAYVFVFRCERYSGTIRPDGTEICEAAYFSLDQLPSPISNFTVQRARDAATFAGRVAVRAQHVSDYRVGPIEG